MPPRAFEIPGKEPNVSHKYDTVSRAASRKSSRETNIVSPEPVNVRELEPLRGCDSTCTDCADRELFGNFDDDVARMRGVVTAILVSVVFFWAPLTLVGVLLWRQS